VTPRSSSPKDLVSSKELNTQRERREGGGGGGIHEIIEFNKIKTNNQIRFLNQLNYPLDKIAIRLS